MKRLFRLSFPFLFCKSWEDFNSVVLILPKFSFKNVVVLVCAYLYQLAFIADGFLYLWIDTRFLLIPTTTLGPFMPAIHLICGVVFAECTLLRSYCLYKLIRTGKSSIVWHTILTKFRQSDHPKFFKVAQFLFSNMVILSSGVIITNHIAKLFEWSTPIDYVAHIALIFIQISLLRFTPAEVPYIYIATYSCYLYVKGQVNLLLHSLDGQS